LATILRFSGILKFLGDDNNINFGINGTTNGQSQSFLAVHFFSGSFEMLSTYI